MSPWGHHGLWALAQFASRILEKHQPHGGEYTWWVSGASGRRLSPLQSPSGPIPVVGTQSSPALGPEELIHMGYSYQNVPYSKLTF